MDANTDLPDVCDTAGVHVFEHLELALIVDDEGSGTGLLWLGVGHICCDVFSGRVDVLGVQGGGGGRCRLAVGGGRGGGQRRRRVYAAGGGGGGRRVTTEEISARFLATANADGVGRTHSPTEKASLSSQPALSSVAPRRPPLIRRSCHPTPCIPLFGCTVIAHTPAI